jgi:calcineurin-like phosphoesterase family protein
MKVFIISDTHFGHKNIIKYCNRPFADTEEMDKAIIKNWNEVVSNKDLVIHLGDVALCGKERFRQIMSQLNGRKMLIRGNHDNWTDEFYREAGFEYVSRYPIVWNEFYILSHAPLQLSETTPYFNYYGHVHNDEKYVDTATSKCVSIERLGYRPLFLFEKNTPPINLNENANSD